jgi:hypothetical protein
MLGWHECQQRFGAMLLGGDMELIREYVREVGAPQERRLTVYRNNVFYKLTEALEATFPAIKRLVGDGFFRYAAHEFIQAYPPDCPMLFKYGSDFGGFFDGFEPASAHPYLGDVARLEFAWLQAYHAMDASPLSTSALQALPTEKYAELRLEVHPSCQFISSKYPIVRIWEANIQEDDPKEEIDLSMGRDHVLVIRPDMEVEVRTLTPAAFCLLDRLDHGATLTNAFEAALNCDKDFNLQDSLQQLIDGQTFTNFEV